MSAAWAALDFALAAVNGALATTHGAFEVLNVGAAIFCFGMGLMQLTSERGVSFFDV